MVFYLHSLNFATHNNKYERSFKRSKKPDSKCKKHTADYQSNENGKRRQIAESTGCYHSNEALCSKAAGNAGNIVSNAEGDINMTLGCSEAGRKSFSDCNNQRQGIVRRL